MIDDLWLFVEWGPNNTWTRADVPTGLRTTRELVDHIRRGGKIQSQWIDLPDHARFIPRVAGMTVLARLAEPAK